MAAGVASAAATTYEVAARDISVLGALAAGARTVSEIDAASRLSSTTVRRALVELAAWGLVAVTGRMGRSTTYALTVQGSASWRTVTTR